MTNRKRQKVKQGKYNLYHG